MTWTDERVELLKKLWADGLSASQIRDALGGVSRNGVMGKVHRLRLEPRESPIKPPAPRERKPKFKPLPRMVKVNGVLVPRVSQSPPHEQRRAAAAAIAPPPSVVMDPETQSARCSIMELRDDRCRWIVGDSREPLEAIYCGGRTSKRPWGSLGQAPCPYCDWHAEMAVGKKAA